MEPVDIKSNKYVDSSKEIHNKDPKFEIGEIVRIAKHFAKGYTANSLEEVLYD